MLPEPREYSLSEQMANWVRWARRHKGLTMRELGEQVGEVTIGTLSNIELGRHVPRPDLAERLGRVLGEGISPPGRAEQAFGAWARKSPGPELVRFLDEQRRRNPESVLPLTASKPGPGRPMRRPLMSRGGGGGPSVLFSRSKEADRSYADTHEFARHVVSVPILEEHADPGDPRTRGVSAVGYQYLDVRAFGDPLEMQHVYMIRLTMETAGRLGESFRARDLVVLTREGVPGFKREFFHVRSESDHKFEIASVMRRDDQLLIYRSHDIDSVRIVDWPRSVEALASLLPARVIGHLRRMGV